MATAGTAAGTATGTAAGIAAGAVARTAAGTVASKLRADRQAMGSMGVHAPKAATLPTLRASPSRPCISPAWECDSLIISPAPTLTAKSAASVRPSRKNNATAIFVIICAFAFWFLASVSACW